MIPTLPRSHADDAPARSRRGRARFASRIGAQLLASVAALSLASACGGGDDSALPPTVPAQPPLARLWVPIFAAPATSIVFDASDSQSPGGSLAHYQFDFGDGSPVLDQGTPLAAYTYAAEGVYAVQLTVIDVAGASASVQSQLTVRADPPLCTNDASCDAGERCQIPACALNPPCAQICLEEVGSTTP